ncbi:MAG: PqiC family protein [Gammaproteobacteria bacterium]
MPLKQYLNYFVLLFGISLLGACASSPPARLYVLEASEDARAETQRSQTPVVRIGPFALADYLDRPQLVTRDDDSRLKVSEFDRWGEELDQAILRVLSVEVGAELQSSGVYPFRAGRLGFDYAVIGSIKSFDADADGLLELEVQWAVRQQDKDSVEFLKISRYNTQTDGGYSEIVDAMNRLLQQFAVEIATEIRKLQAAVATEAN